MSLLAGLSVAVTYLEILVIRSELYKEHGDHMSSLTIGSKCRLALLLSWHGAERSTAMEIQFFLETGVELQNI